MNGAEWLLFIYFFFLFFTSWAEQVPSLLSSLLSGRTHCLELGMSPSQPGTNLSPPVPGSPPLAEEESERHGLAGFLEGRCRTRDLPASVKALAWQDIQDQTNPLR